MTDTNERLRFIKAGSPGLQFWQHTCYVLYILAYLCSLQIGIRHKVMTSTIFFFNKMFSFFWNILGTWLLLVSNCLNKSDKISIVMFLSCVPSDIIIWVLLSDVFYHEGDCFQYLNTLNFSSMWSVFWEKLSLKENQCLFVTTIYHLFHLFCLIFTEHSPGPHTNVSMHPGKD